MDNRPANELPAVAEAAVSPIDEENGNQNPAVGQLTNGFLNLYEADMIRVKHSVQEILAKQDRMAEDLRELNDNYSAETLVAPQTLFDQVRIYKDKLHSIKKQMNNIHQRSKTLKKRVQTLQDFRTKEINDRKQKLQQEEALIAKSAAMNK